MAGKGSADVREEIAGRGTGSQDTQLEIGGGQLDLSQYAQPESQQPEGQPQEAAAPGSTIQQDYYDAAAAQAQAEAEERARRAEEERRRIEAENEQQHRQNDARNREEELAQQQERRSKESNITPASIVTPTGNTETENRVTEQAGEASTMRPVEGYDNLVQDENGAYYPKEGTWATNEAAVDDLARLHDEAMFDEGGFADYNPNELNNTSPWERYEEIASTTGPSINDAVRLDAARQHAEQQSGQTYEEYQRSKQQQTGSQQGQQQQQNNTQGQQQQSQQPDEEESTYQQVEDFIRRTSQERITQAYRANALEREAWLQANPGKTAEDYELSDEYWEDAEAFAKTLKSMLKEQTMGFDDVQYDDEGNLIDPGAGTKQKENKNQSRLIDSVVRAFKLGFFHITTEQIKTDETTGEQSLRWSLPVETRIVRLCDYFGMDYNMLDSQRTIFRLVTLYASMGVDRHGKMFNEGKDEWSLTEDEFCKICDMIYAACNQKNGHPLIPPWRTSYGSSALRGTDIIPSGVLPSVVARAITGENSKLRNAEGKVPLPSELMEMARQTWVTDTYPWIKENLVNEPQRGKPKKDKDGNPIKPRNRMAQRIAIEDMQQALARLDGKDASTFSNQYGVDTTPHYRIGEYKNTHKVYAEAMDDAYDSQAVSDYQNELLDNIERQAKDQKNSKEYSMVAAGANIVTSGIRTNALFWNVPIMMSAIAEKGVGDVQTDFAIRAIASRTERVTGVKRMDVSQQLRDALKTDEAQKALDAALFLLDIEGPQALMLYAKENPNTPLTPESAAAFYEKKYMPRAKNAGAAKAREIQQKLSKFQQTILTGDVAFRNYDAKNFLNAFLTCNQVLLGAQTQLANEGLIDKHAGLALTGAEIDDAFMACNGDIALFIGDMMQLAAGRDALIMMRNNNIGNFNPVGYAINRFLRNHGVPDAMITAVLDSFPKYGVNFLYAMTPFSRSLSYLAMKKREANGDTTAGMLVMGGSLADVSNVETFKQAMSDPAFRAGIRMNLMYDAMVLGRWSVTALVLGGIMAILGFEPPDNPDDWQNVSRWKIGGQELAMAYWLNDLTQLGLPLAIGFAATASGHSDKALQLTLNSLYDQIDGNVIVDFAKYVKGWTDEMAELDKIASDPSYISGFDPGYGVLELMLSAGDKIVPGAPLYRYIANNAFIRGSDADAKSPYKVFDKSTDWAKEVGKTDYVTDAHQRQIRKHCTANWLLATYENMVQSTMPWDQENENTGYYWWQMPSKTKQDDLILTLSAQQQMDYKNRENCKTDKEYKEHRTDDLIAMINKWSDDYGGLDQAVMNGFFIEHDIRYAALEVLSERAAQEDIVFQNKVDTGELVKYSDEFYTELANKKDRVNEIWKYIHILQNKDVPMWNEGYTQILSDKEVDYYHEDGSSASPWEYFFPVNGPVEVKVRNKGNHPWAMAPFTLVDKTSTDQIKRDPVTGNTLNFWETFGENGGTDLEKIINGIGQETVPMGVNEGRVLNDVLFNTNSATGELVHPNIATVDDRAWKPIKGYLSDDIKNFDAAARIKEMIEKDENKADEDKNNSKNKTTYPRSFSSGGSYKRSGGSRSSYEYNPKIYSTHAQNTHISGSRISSTRTSPVSRSVNADKAATMYSKQPSSTKVNTYLRPGFETKGSREAYKRQDI